MKTWKVGVMLGMAVCITGCSTTAVMVLKNVHKRRLKYKSPQRIKTCLGRPERTVRMRGVKMWQYRYRAPHNRQCLVQLYFKNNRFDRESAYAVKLTNIPAHSKGKSPCQMAKESFGHCLKFGKHKTYKKARKAA